MYVVQSDWSISVAQKKRFENRRKFLPKTIVFWAMGSYADGNNRVK